MKKKGLTKRVSPKYGIDRLRVLRKRETDTKTRDRLPINGTRAEPENAA